MSFFVQLRMLISSWSWHPIVEARCWLRTKLCVDKHTTDEKKEYDEEIAL